MNPLSLDFNQTLRILTLAKGSVLVEGHMGSGKSSLLNPVAEARKSKPIYLDCSSLDLGDLFLPDLNNKGDQACIRFVPNEALGLHTGERVVIMLDEFGKSNPAVKTALLRLVLEHQLGSYKLPGGSLVFATSNLGREGVSDLLPPHARNRLTCIELRKPSAQDWLEWAVLHGVPVQVLAWVNELGDTLFADFREAQASENPYIYHPSSPEVAFVTPRSLALAGQWFNQGLTEEELTAVLCGTLGTRAGLDLQAFVSVYNEVPRLSAIKEDPKHCKVPLTIAGQAMLIFSVVQSLKTKGDKELFKAWMIYVKRLQLEIQALFVTHVRNPDKIGAAMFIYSSREYIEWATQNSWLYMPSK